MLFSKGSTRSNSSIKLATGTVLAHLCLMCYIPISSTFTPQIINCGSGKQTWTGTVLDQEGSGLPRVVVYVATKPFYQPGANGITQTDANGDWAVQLNSPCPVSATFYWTGIGGTTTTSNRPELLNVPTYTNYAQESVNVWWTPQDTQIAYEFPNTNQATIEVISSKTFSLSDNVYVQGSMSDGFIGVNAGGRVGTNLTVQTDNTYSNNAPYEAYYQTGNSIKVEDINGNYMVYKQEFNSSVLISGQDATDYMTMTQAINDGASYLTINHGGTSTQYVSVTGTVSIDSQVGITAFGIGLGTEVGVSHSTENGVYLSVHNPYSYTECFVVYNQGFDFHVWLYSNNICP